MLRADPGVRFWIIEVAENDIEPEIVAVVDAITSVGALPIGTDDWGLDAVIGVSEEILAGRIRGRVVVDVNA